MPRLRGALLVDQAPPRARDPQRPDVLGLAEMIARSNDLRQRFVDRLEDRSRAGPAQVRRRDRGHDGLSHLDHGAFTLELSVAFPLYPYVQPRRPSVLRRCISQMARSNARHAGKIPPGRIMRTSSAR
jgi:hypothetical protein